MITREDVYYARTNPQALADKINLIAATGAKVAVVAGAATGAVAIGATVASIVAVFAVTTATGAVAAKFLLEDVNDYTLGVNNTLTMEVDLSGKTLIVIYK